MSALNHLGLFLMCFFLWLMLYLWDVTNHEKTVEPVTKTWYFPILTGIATFAIIELFYWSIYLLII